MKNKIIKLLFTSLIIFSFSITSIASTVSDNDGSAFITKAEFDSLKNTFQSQIDEYNSSIDNKIDSAIASYLAGISITTKTNTTALFKNFGVSTITSMKPADIAYSEEIQGWINTLVWSSIYGPYSQKIAKFNWHSDATTGKRGLVEELKIGTTTYYKWAGYTTDYKQTNSMNLCGWNGLGQDTGYSAKADPYWQGFGYNTQIKDSSGGNHTRHELNKENAWSFCLSPFNSTQISGKKWNNGFQSTVWRYSISCDKSYTTSKEYDYMFLDSSTGSSSTAYNLRLKDDIKYYTMGTTKTQYNIWHDLSSKDTLEYLTACQFKSYDDAASCTPGGTEYLRTELAGKLDYTPTNKSAYMGYGHLITAPITSNNNSWNDIYYKDTNKYEYTGDSGTASFQYYKMTAGIPLAIVSKDNIIKWKVTFTDATPKYVYLQYGTFSSGADTTKTIKVSTDGGKNYAKYATVTTSATIQFEADKNGIIFVKWRNASDTSGGGTLDVANSSAVTSESTK